MKTLFTATLSLLFLSPTSTLTAQVDTFAISQHLNWQTNRIFKNDYAVVVVKDNKVAYKRETEDITLKTPQPIGPASQWLTAALVMTLVQEGKISLDDRVSKYIPLFEKYYKGYITIRHCLTHFTGIQTDKLFAKNKFKTLEEAVNDIASKREIDKNAGEESKYSNLGFLIAGRVLEIVSKKSFDRLFTDKIGRPSGMKTATFSNEDYNDAINPATGARASAIDYGNFLMMLLNKGTFNNKPVLTEASVNTLLSLQVQPSVMKNVPEANKGYAYALGSWISAVSDSDAPLVFTAPSYSGTMPVLNLCKKYGYVLLTKDLSSPPSASYYVGLQQAIDDAVGGGCN